MKNAIKFLGFIALVAVIGFSFAACGDAEQGPTGPKGDQGPTGSTGPTGPEGPMRPDILLPYIPEESGLLDTTWTYSATDKVIFSADGYTVTTTYGSGFTRQVFSYGKRPNGTYLVTASGSSSSPITYFTISGNTLKWTTGNETYTKQ
jgi:hypothetical protein